MVTAPAMTWARATASWARFVVGPTSTTRESAARLRRGLERTDLVAAELEALDDRLGGAGDGAASAPAGGGRSRDSDS